MDHDDFLPSPLSWSSALIPDGSGTKQAALSEQNRSSCVGPQAALPLLTTSSQPPEGKLPGSRKSGSSDSSPSLCHLVRAQEGILPGSIPRVVSFPPGLTVSPQSAKASKDQPQPVGTMREQAFLTSMRERVYYHRW